MDGRGGTYGNTVRIFFVFYLPGCAKRRAPGVGAVHNGIFEIRRGSWNKTLII